MKVYYNISVQLYVFVPQSMKESSHLPAWNVMGFISQVKSHHQAIVPELDEHQAAGQCHGGDDRWTPNWTSYVEERVMKQ